MHQISSHFYYQFNHSYPNLNNINKDAIDILVQIWSEVGLLIWWALRYKSTSTFIEF